MTQQDTTYMQYAIKLAQKAWQLDEVPVGAVIVSHGEIVGRGFNKPINSNDPTAHAEIIALRQAAIKIGNYRLVDATLYATLEPCVMCLGAMVHTRIKRLVFGAYDPKAGAVCSKFSLLDNNQFNHVIEYSGGVLAEECSDLLRRFFQERRSK